MDAGDDRHVRGASPPAMPPAAEMLLPARPSTPPARPASAAKKTVYGDRFIPSRDGLDIQASFHLLRGPDVAGGGSGGGGGRRSTQIEIDAQKLEEADRTFEALLRSEIFGEAADERPSGGGLGSASRGDSVPRTPPPPSATAAAAAHSVSLPSTPATPARKLFSYTSPSAKRASQSNTPGSRGSLSSRGSDNPMSEVYSLSPVRLNSQALLLSPRKQPRVIPKIPYKVLDAPELADDFYLNLVDWGSSNVLAVGLGCAVYLWFAQNGKVQKLCEVKSGTDSITSVSWIGRGTHLAVGTYTGSVQIWDIEQCKRIRAMTGHSQRVGALAWNEHILTSGSRDPSILHRDVRVPAHFFRQIHVHKQEVCGLKWNIEDGQLASGGNDNKLYIWDKTDPTPLHKFSSHTAAVKAIAWSSHQRGILASGGGTADRKIKVWNTMLGQLLHDVDTGSQVCNLAWSKNSNEIVSTHGYSQNQIVVWKFPNMSQVAALTGHTYRVLYLAMSPDGQSIVTGAGDETLRFWNVFGKNKNDLHKSPLLFDAKQIR